MKEVKESDGGCSEDYSDMYSVCKICMGGGSSGIVMANNPKLGMFTGAKQVG